MTGVQTCALPICDDEPGDDVPGQVHVDELVPQVAVDQRVPRPDVRHAAVDDPEAFGMMIADITRHVGRIYADRFPEEQTVERIRAIYDAEMDAPTDPGTTTALS